MISGIKQFNQLGDTIVEVLLAIAVLSLSLGWAFAISSRSKNTIQANQERYQAQLIANGQADNIKIYMANNDNDNFLCFDQSGNPLDTENSCSNIDNLYKIVIKKQTSTDIFLITVSWSSLIGGQDNVELVYGT